MPPETRFLIPLYRKRATFGDLGDPANRRAVARFITQGKGTKFIDLRLDAAAIEQRIVDGTPTIGAAAATVFASFAQAHGKARWGEKRPAYWSDMDVVLRLFPDAQIVHLIRDPRACVSSMKQLPWWISGFDGAVVNWLLAMERIPRDTRALGVDSYHELYYEQLVSDPQTVLAQLCRFLGEDFDEAMLQHDRAAQQIVPSRKSWHRLTAQPVDTSRTEAWRSGLSAAEIGLIELVCRRRMGAHGYEFSDLGVHPPASMLASFTRAYTRRRAGIRARRMLDAVQRRRETAPVAAALTDLAVPTVPIPPSSTAQPQVSGLAKPVSSS